MIIYICRENARGDNSFIQSKSVQAVWSTYVVIIIVGHPCVHTEVLERVLAKLRRINTPVAGADSVYSDGKEISFVKEIALQRWRSCALRPFFTAI